MKKPKVCRADLPAGACLCDHCTGKCCRYFSMPITTPATQSHYDAIGRYLRHEKTLVYVDKGTWYLLVSTRCKYLTRDNRCQIYFNRPKICQEYTTDECEYDEDWAFEKMFDTAEQIEEYAEAVLPPRRGSGGRLLSLPDFHRPGPDCRCFCVPIDPPTTWDDYDAIRWYLAHGQTVVDVSRGKWTLVVLSGGPNDAPSARCRIDERAFASQTAGSGRPRKIFESPEELWEYAEIVLPPRRRSRSAGPALPIVSIG